MSARDNISMLAAAIAMVTIAGCGLSLSVTLIALRLDMAGYAGGAIGLNTAAGGVASLVSAPLIPWLARRMGVARLLLAALGLGGLAMTGFTLVSDYWSWLALRFVTGVSVTVLFVLSEFWINTVAAPGRQGFVIGLYATCLGIGFAAGPAFLALSGTAGSLPFYVGAGLFWAASLPLAFNRRGAPALVETSRRPFWTYLRDAPVATLAGMLHGAIEVAGIGLLPVYALRAGASAAEGALLVSLFVMGNTALQIPLGLLSDRVERGALLMTLAGMALAGALCLAATGLSHLILFETVLLLWGGLAGGLYPVGLAQLGARYRGGDLAGANASFVMAYSFGMLAGPPLAGFGLDLWPPMGFFAAIALLAAVYLIYTMASLLRQGQKARP